MSKHPTVDELRPKVAKILKGVKVFMGFDKEYPECLEMVVIGDVGPDRMEKVCDLLRKEGEGKLRLCANIIEKRDAHHFEALSDEAAFEQAWEFGIATVRMG